MYRILKADYQTIRGTDDKVWGNHNIITGKNALVVGNNNTVVAMNSIVYGNNNNVISYGSTVYGMNNKVSGVRSRKYPPSSSPPRYEDYIDLEMNNNNNLRERVVDTLSDIGRNMFIEFIDSRPPKIEKFSMLELDGNAMKADDNSPQNILCVICMTNFKNIMLNPCSHVVYCIECARNDRLSNKCPICRKKYASAQVIFI